MNTIPALDHLEQELVAAIHRDQAAAGAQHRFTGRRKIFTTGGLILAGGLAATVTAVTVLGGPPAGDRNKPSYGAQSAAALVSFTSRTDGVRIVFKDLHADASAINAELRRHDIPLTVTFTPASPSKAGKPLAVLGRGGAGALSQLKYTRSATADRDILAVTVPNDLTGRNELFVGRRALPGEQYAASGDAEAPGEALHCHPVVGKLVSEALPQFAAAQVTVSWRTKDGHSASLDEVKSDYVTSVTSLSATTVVAATAASSGGGEHQASDGGLPADCRG